MLTGTAGVSGVLKLSQSGDGPTKVVGSITGLAPGKHGLHIHEFGDTTNGCMSTGPHFNPNKMDHGAPTDATRHAGDLGNVEATAGGCDFVIEDSQIPLSGANSIIGRAFVIHELEDDLGKGDSSEIGTQGKTSKTTGNAGAVRRRRDFDAISTIATRRDAISTRFRRDFEFVFRGFGVTDGRSIASVRASAALGVRRPRVGALRVSAASAFASRASIARAHISINHAS